MNVTIAGCHKALEWSNGVCSGWGDTCTHIKTRALPGNFLCTWCICSSHHSPEQLHVWRANRISLRNKLWQPSFFLLKCGGVLYLGFFLMYPFAPPINILLLLALEKQTSHCLLTNMLIESWGTFITPDKTCFTANQACNILQNSWRNWDCIYCSSSGMIPLQASEYLYNCGGILCSFWFNFRLFN